MSYLRITFLVLIISLFINGYSSNSADVTKYDKDAPPSGLHFLACKVQKIRADENFNMLKFSGDWYEIARTHSGYLNLKSSRWKFFLDSQNKNSFLYTAVARDDHCIRPLTGKIDVSTSSPGNLVLFYKTFGTLVEEKLQVLYTDYKNIAVLYSCQHIMPSTGSCHPAGMTGAVLSRRKSIDSDTFQQALSKLKEVCIDPSLLIHQHHDMTCHFDDVEARTDEDDIPGPDYCYYSPSIGDCKGDFRRYFYNPRSEKCETYVYSGCGGNRNNFLTLHECQHKCIELARKTQCSHLATCAIACPPCCREKKDSCIVCDCEDIVIDPPAIINEQAQCVPFASNCSENCQAELKYPGCYICRCNLNVFVPFAAQGRRHEFRVNKVEECPGRCRYTEDKDQNLCNCTNQDVCNLPKDSGPCDGTTVRYYFDSESGTCETFRYGGCQGNLNNFKSLRDCTKFCSDICYFQEDVGHCDQRYKRYHFNPHSMTCNIFPYSGCGGNENRFMEEVNCKKRCEDVCTEPVDPGHCTDNIVRYYYNNENKKCEEFVYGGCMGNKNNFYTLSECEKRCEGNFNGFLIRNDSICRLSPDTGPCRSFVTRYYYNATTRSCEEFIYGGCEGNKNKFELEEECSARCHGVKFKAAAACSMTGTCEEDCIIKYDSDGCFQCKCSNSANGNIKRFSTWISLVIFTLFVRFLF